MNIGVIGGGATGLLLSYYLSMSHELTLYVRRHIQKEKIATHGIVKINGNVSKTIQTKQINDLQTHDLIIICVKSSAVKSVIKKVKEKRINTPLLFLQNGMSHTSLFSHLKNDVFVGVIEHGVVRVNDFTFNHLGEGEIKISSVHENGQVNELQKHLTNEQFPIVVHNDWERLLKEKLMINAVINPLTALFNVDNRYIIENLAIKKIAKQLCYDVAAILALDKEESWQRVKMIAINTGNNTSSMRSDILHKQQTEVDAILGYVLKQTTTHYPQIELLYQSIKALEERNQSL